MSPINVTPLVVDEGRLSHQRRAAAPLGQKSPESTKLVDVRQQHNEHLMRSCGGIARYPFSRIQTEPVICLLIIRHK